MKSSESLFIVIKTKKILPWYLEILEQAQQKNEINPHLTKEMMLLYIQMFTKLGDDFGAKLLEGDREKHIQDIVTMFFYGLSDSTKIKRHEIRVFFILQ